MKSMKIEWDDPKACCDKRTITIHEENGDGCSLRPGMEVSCADCGMSGVVVELEPTTAEQVAVENARMPFEPF